MRKGTTMIAEGVRTVIGTTMIAEGEWVRMMIGTTMIAEGVRTVIGTTMIAEGKKHMFVTKEEVNIKVREITV